MRSKFFYEDGSFGVLVTKVSTIIQSVRTNAAAKRKSIKLASAAKGEVIAKTNKTNDKIAQIAFFISVISS